ncbi:MAG: UDP-N-acetylmuramate dehydrogenase [Eubacteriales bacterium]|nr:UDP-N-acetylmuramate dehydrogenase [Eubacteriales bacterium]
MEKLENAIAEIKKVFPGMKILENEPMRAHCSFRTGGPVRALAYPSDLSSLTKLCCILKEHELAPLMLGNCTNIVFPDEGMSEVFAICTEKLTKLFLLPDGAIYAECGVPLSRLAAFAQQNGLAGLEFASGIPGSVGGGVMMNAGAYGGELKDAVESVVCYYLPEQRLYEVTAEKCQFGYRDSFFKKLPGNVIISAVFRLHEGDKDEIAAKMRELNERRRDKQPLDLPSAGSAFKRPEGHYAAALIDEAGLKGFSVGGAQVSEKHAGFIVNTGNATSADIHELMKQVRKRVYDNSQVLLEPEIILLPPDYKLEDRGPQVPRNKFIGLEEMTGGPDGGSAPDAE